jgi:hypothetical protein
MSGLSVHVSRCIRDSCIPSPQSGSGPPDLKTIRRPSECPPDIRLSHAWKARLLLKFPSPERWMSGLSRTPGKRVYGESRTAGSNPALSAMVNA